MSDARRPEKVYLRRGPSESDTDLAGRMTEALMGQMAGGSEPTGGEAAVDDQVVRFEHDDEGYVAWLAANPTGFVINCAPTPSADYLVLHRASCMHISVTGDNMEHWTHQYIKVCSARNGALLRWCDEEVGGRPSRCSTCAPLAGNRQTSSKGAS